MKTRMFFARLTASLVYPLLGFVNYWRAFDGEADQADLLSGIVVSGVLSVAIFMYFPIAKKVENFSLAWFLGLIVSLNLVLCGGYVMSGSLYSPVEFRAWGNYMLLFGVFMPVMHVIFRSIGKPRKKGAFFKRIRLLEDAEKKEKMEELERRVARLENPSPRSEDAKLSDS